MRRITQPTPADPDPDAVGAGPRHEVTLGRRSPFAIGFFITLGALTAFGLVFGRWWRSALIAAAVVWPALLWWNGVLQSAPSSQPVLVHILLASLLAVLNASVGVGVHQLVLFMIRRLRPTGDD